MTDPTKILQSSELVVRLAAVATDGRFDVPTVAAEMMKHGYAMLTGLPLDAANRAVFAMLKLYEREYVDVPKVGPHQ